MTEAFPALHPVTCTIATTALAGLTAEETATALADGVRSIITNADVTITTLPAEGPGIADMFAGERITLPTITAAGTLTEATYLYDPASTTAVIDAAAVTGTSSDALPSTTGDSYGIGVLIADAQTRGASRVILATAGSLANDGGAGILVALGANPLNAAGHTLPKGAKPLADLADFDTAQVNIPAAAMDFVVVVDTDAPLDSTVAGLTRLAEFSGVDPHTTGLAGAGSIAVGLTWLSALIHGDAAHVVITPAAQLLADAVDPATVLDKAPFIITSGPLGAKLAATATAEHIVGVVTEEPVNLGEPTATILTAELPAPTSTGSPAAQLRSAGAHLAADYLRVATVAD